MSFLKILSHVFLLGAASSSFGAGTLNLVTNGSFEAPNVATSCVGAYCFARNTTNATGWSRTGANWVWLDSRAGGLVASDGNQFTEVESGYAGAIFTSLATQIGKTYLVEFDYSANPYVAATSADDSIRVRVDGAEKYYFDGIRPSGTHLEWSRKSFTFVAAHSATELRFVDGLASVAHNGPMLDNVSVTAAVPEPAQAWLLALGIAGLVVRLRKR